MKVKHATNVRDVMKRYAVRRVRVSGVVKLFAILKVFFVFKSNFNQNSMNSLIICHRNCLFFFNIENFQSYKESLHT